MIISLHTLLFYLSFGLFLSFAYIKKRYAKEKQLTNYDFVIAFYLPIIWAPLFLLWLSLNLFEQEKITIKKREFPW